MIYLPQPNDLCVLADVRNEANLDANPMPIYQIAISAPGSYSVAPTASVVAGTGIGSGLTLGAVTLSNGGIGSVAISTPGSYSVAPLIQFTGGTGNGGSAIAYFYADNNLQRFISQSSSEMLSQMYRNQALPFLTAETRNGSGTSRMALKYWPVVSVTSVYVGTNTIPQSPDGIQYGWVCDGSSVLIVGSSGWYGGLGSSFSGWPFPGGLGAFPRGAQNVTFNYTYGWPTIPGDIVDATIELAATKFKRKGYLDQTSVAIGDPAQTTRYTGKALTSNAERVIARYRILPVMEL